MPPELLSSVFASPGLQAGAMSSMDPEQVSRLGFDGCMLEACVTSMVASFSPSHCSLSHKKRACRCVRALIRTSFSHCRPFKRVQTCQLMPHFAPPLSTCFIPCGCIPALHTAHAFNHATSASVRSMCAHPHIASFFPHTPCAHPQVSLEALMAHPLMAPARPRLGKQGGGRSNGRVRNGKGAFVLRASINWSFYCIGKAVGMLCLPAGRVRPTWLSCPL